MSRLPPCGLYVTTADVGAVPAGRLVYFHNHGDPGPGLYLPSGWKANRAHWRTQGVPLPEPASVRLLEPLPREGFYRVTEAFHCCAKRCRRFEPEALVQLGYDARAQAILFLPELVDGMLAIPERGSRIDRDRLACLQALKLRTSGSGALH